MHATPISRPAIVLCLLCFGITTFSDPLLCVSDQGRRFDKETLASAKRLEEGANSREQHAKGEEEQYAKIDSPGWISLSKKCWTSIHIGGRDL